MQPAAHDAFSSQDGENDHYYEVAPEKLAKPQVFEQIWRAIVSNRLIIAAIIVVCLALGFITTILATPHYTAVSRIEISRQQDNVTNVETLEQDGFDKNEEFYQTQYSLLEARSLAERVARALNLASDDEFFATFEVDPEEAGLFQVAAGSATEQRLTARLDLAIEILLDHVDIVPVRGSSLVDVQFTSPDPQLSATIANTWVTQFVASTLDRRFASTADAREFLEERLAQLRQQLEDSERNLTSYAANEEIIALSSRQDVAGQTSDQRTLAAADLEALNDELARARGARIAAESTLRTGAGAQESMSNGALVSLRTRRAELAAQRAQLLTQFEEGYPAVEALTSQIASLDQAIAQEEARAGLVKTEAYRSALQREQVLESQVAALKNQLLDEQRASIQYNIFQREVNTNRELYNALLQRYKEIGVAGVGANNVAIVDRAQSPKEPSSPSLPLNAALSLLLGMLLSGGFIYVREQIDQSLRDPADVQNLLGLTQLGLIPVVEKGEIESELRDRKSAVSEAYFSVATSLSFLTNHGAPRTLLFTSSRPNEGKSTSAFALATQFARTGKRALLVDADMRNPSAQEFFGLSNDSGLSNFLTGEEDISARDIGRPHQR